jgi:predicted kinase
VIVQLAGLPGTGKSALATELARRLQQRALVLDKDRVRDALFGPRHTRYTREQDDFCVRLMFQAAAWQLRHAPGTVVVLDGRPCVHAYQVAEVRRFAAGLGQPLRIIECACPDSFAEQRLRADAARSEHPATDRGVGLYRRLKAVAEAIPEPKLRLDTARPLSECADHALAYLRLTGELS